VVGIISLFEIYGYFRGLLGFKENGKVGIKESFHSFIGKYHFSKVLKVMS
jgi:hypothetical protein